MDDCKKKGILGGTFNPVHNGHLMIAENAYKEFDLSEVWMMPAYIPPHKRHEFILDDEFRLAMVAKAVEDVPYLKVSDYEIQRGNVSYTANTLTELKSLYPENEYFFIMGADSLMDFETWYHPEIILQKANLIVAARDDVDQKRLK